MFYGITILDSQRAIAINRQLLFTACGIRKNDYLENQYIISACHRNQA